MQQTILGLEADQCMSVRVLFRCLVASEEWRAFASKTDPSAAFKAMDMHADAVLCRCRCLPLTTGETKERG